MNICLIIPTLNCGGAERVCADLAIELLSNHHHIAIMTLKKESEDFFKVPFNISRIKLNLVNSSGSYLGNVFFILKNIILVRREIKLIEPNLIISFLPQTNITSILATLKKIPVIINEMSDPEVFLLGIEWRAMRRITYPLCAKFITPTKSISEKFYWLSEKKKVVIPNFITDVNKDIVPIDTEIFGNNVKTIVSMGRLDYLKGFDILINAFSEVGRHNSNWQLLIIGDGPLKEELKLLTLKLDIQSKVKFLGNLRNPFTYLKKSDLFVLSSRSECFGNVIIEAMACGLPVISTNCLGPTEIITHGVDGILTEGDNVNSLSDAMSDLIGNKNKRRVKITLEALF